MITNWDGVVETEDVVKKMAFIIYTHPNISSIRFTGCSSTIEICLMATGRDQLAALELIDCSIDIFKASVLVHILDNNRLQKILIQDCHFDRGAADLLNESLSRNTSLEYFGLIGSPIRTQKEWLGRGLNWHRMGHSLTKGILGILGNNNNKIQHVLIDVRNTSFVEICKASSRNTILETFETSVGAVRLDCVTAIARMVESSATLKKLAFQNCAFDQNAMSLLLHRLSEDSTRLQSLDFTSVAIGRSERHTPQLLLDWAHIKVKSLRYAYMGLDLGTFSSMIDGIAANTHIQTLNLWGSVITEAQFQKVCQTFLVSNQGPSELYIDHVGPRGPTLLRALQHNRSIEILRIVDLELPHLVALARALNNLDSLCELHIGVSGRIQEYSKEFFAVLLQSMEGNVTLKRLVLNGMASVAEETRPFIAKIQYFLAFNQVGRHSLLTANIPSVLWAHVLASKPVLAQKDLTQFFLTERPDIIIDG
jgi:hypothetical protein